MACSSFSLSLVVFLSALLLCAALSPLALASSSSPLVADNNSNSLDLLVSHNPVDDDTLIGRFALRFVSKCNATSVAGANLICEAKAPSQSITTTVSPSTDDIAFAVHPQGKGAGVVVHALVYNLPNNAFTEVGNITFGEHGAHVLHYRSPKDEPAKSMDLPGGGGTLKSLHGAYHIVGGEGKFAGAVGQLMVNGLLDTSHLDDGSEVFFVGIFSVPKKR
ncbi:hypothetical protein QOT17_003817 [Balamuthia mandrillaris]